MRLNEVKLPQFIVTELYKNHLVDLNVEAAEPARQTDINFLGGKGKQILFVVKSNDARFLPDRQLEFLSGILSACQLNMGDIAIVNIYKIPDSEYKDIIESMKAETIILIDVEGAALRLPFKIPDFQVQLFKNRKYLFVPGLDAIENDKELKRKLWDALKNIFFI